MSVVSGCSLGCYKPFGGQYRLLISCLFAKFVVIVCDFVFWKVLKKVELVWNPCGEARQCICFLKLSARGVLVLRIVFHETKSPSSYSTSSFHQAKDSIYRAMIDSDDEPIYFTYRRSINSDHGTIMDSFCAGSCFFILGVIWRSTPVGYPSMLVFLLLLYKHTLKRFVACVSLLSECIL